MMYTNDNRIVMTLDAGGTNFVFSAIQGGKEIADSSSGMLDCLDKCLGNLVEGFKAIQAGLSGNQSLSVRFSPVRQTIKPVS